MFLNKIVPVPLVDSIADKVETAIIQGTLPLGSRISEASLAAELGVSRSPLREALRRLEGRKLVERTPNHGARVVTFTLADIVELLHVREALEGMVCRLAAVNASSEDLDSLEAILVRQAECAREEVVDPFDNHDNDFHFQVAKASKNAKLVVLLCNDLYAQLRVCRYRSGLSRARQESGYREHEQILEALRTRNADEAEQAMRRHIARGRENLCAAAADKE
jgi:DNA-binding GntR family transcriptional regulator